MKGLYKLIILFLILILNDFSIITIKSLLLFKSDILTADLKIKEYNNILKVAGIGGDNRFKYEYKDDIYLYLDFLIKHYNLNNYKKTFEFLGYPFKDITGTYIWRWDCQFGYRDYDNSFHVGSDLCNVYDSELISISDGFIKKIGYDNSYGNYIIIESIINKQKFRFLYAHLNFVNVAKDEKIKTGQRIGIMGTTGKSTGTHLHLEVLKLENNKWIYYNYFANNLHRSKYFLKYEG